MNNKLKVLLAVLITAWTLCESRSGFTQSEHHFIDPLDAPAAEVQGAQQAQRQPLLALAQAGQRIVAVGFRGLIITTDDQGRTWKQSKVPVQSDLVAVTFVSNSKGWAAGHDGVILQTLDGGLNWSKQLDLLTARAAFPNYYQQKIDGGSQVDQQFLAEVEKNFEGDTSLPYLGLAFEDESKGFAVGAFGMIASTVDGGKSWQPAVDRIDNDEQLNLNAIRKIGGHLYIAGERGVVFRMDVSSGRFIPVQTGYSGSYFDIVGNDKVLIAFGLRGTAYRSLDQGANWQKVDTKTATALYGGVFLADGSLLLVSESGELLLGNDQGKNFERLNGALKAHVASALSIGDNNLLVVGYGGVDAKHLGSGLPAGDQ
ncbi:MAG: photosynthesis system assembly factor family protein [Pseudomonas sp.]|nr:photosynthesis system assembly factor family protein [Pseudomonas sp.]